MVGEARTAARSGGVHRPSHAQHVPNNRWTNQNHLLSISLTFSLDALPAARFFTPGTRLILQSTHEPPKLWVQLAGHHSYSSDLCLRKQRTILLWNTFQNSIIYHKPSSELNPLYLLWWAHWLLHSSWVCLSNFHQLNNCWALSSPASTVLLKYINGSWPEHQMHHLHDCSITVWVISTN